VATAEQIELLRQVHADVRAHGTWKPDSEVYGQEEYWATAAEIRAQMERLGGRFEDDCDGWAVLARAGLKELGLPARLVFCRLGDEGHLVVEVDGWIVDNRHGHVESRDDLAKTGYEFVMRSGLNPGDDWHYIE
jgi:predicted transglutaminase-like cysteine proteinase